MATENPLRFIRNEYNGAGKWPLNKDTSEFASTSNSSEDLRLLLKGQKYHGNKNTGPGRSGSAPPSMEGSSATFDILTSVDFDNNLVKSCKSEGHLAHPAYLAYYGTNVNLNPRLNPPLISQGSQNLMEHNGGFENNKRTPSSDDTSKSSFFTSGPALSTHNEEAEDDRSPVMESSDCRNEREDTAPVQGHIINDVDLVQGDSTQAQDPEYNDHSHSSNQIMEQAVSQDFFSTTLHDSPIGMTNPEIKTPTFDVHGCTTHSGSQLNGDPGAKSVACSASTEKTASLHVGQYESSSALGTMENCVSTSGMIGSDTGDIEDGMQKLRLSSDSYRSHQSRHNSQQLDLHAQCSSHSEVVSQGVLYSQSTVDHLFHGHHGQSMLPSVHVQPFLQSAGVEPPLYVTGAGYGSPYYHNLQLPSMLPPQFSLSGYALNPSQVPQFVTHPNHSPISLPFGNPMSPDLNARASGIPTAGSVVSDVDMQQLYGQFGLPFQPLFPDPSYVPFYQHPSVDVYATACQYDSAIPRVGAVGSIPGTYDVQNTSGSAYLPDQRPQVPRVGFNVPNTINGGPLSPNYYGSPPNICAVLQFPSSPVASPNFQASPVTTTNFSGRKSNNVKFPFGSERKATSSSGWQSQRGNEKVDGISHSLIEELKSNKTLRYELSDIAGHVVEFSVDQYGSRFIQQKLETCSMDERESVFKEVLPHASSLMIDVFGNYVIQKFLEHGSAEQRKELASKLVGNVLSLSLQMYGCRVIQKALEFIELDQKTQLVQELDGNVIRCVWDQNGNHVIQKCIECVPTEKIRFIISSFCGQVATLSTHPYGCRVIQRVLENCLDEYESQCIVDEILQSTPFLALDQYGNYVTQHILVRGNPNERSQVISKLSGQIVQMSQHKFASNVVEKCFEYGNTEERDHLIKEIVGETEGSDNLLVMVKDQFANYVVQKILDTCNDEQLEVMINHIKVHLRALKKYTYGKHIVTRIEQLCDEDVPES
ncbi:hypothetical protein Cni_G27816 [Canna indica]|uniref:PUM-HD domain-containing protein n=1 Tax=Canna indica TaxID=4628 RepID=A0AAQ3QPP2_9LILI|nr:hypothetical protein Cni_G27816 [Canna indica]